MSQPTGQLNPLVDDMVEIFRAVCTGEDLEETFAKWLRRIPVDPERERPTAAELVRLVGAGVIFRTPGRARYVAGLFAALNSRTWGQFRSRIPGEEWERLKKQMKRVPRSNDSFDEAAVPGLKTGDWPPTTDQEKKAVILAFLNVLPPAPGRA